MNDGFSSILASVIEQNGKSEDFWLDIFREPAAHFLATGGWLQELSGKHLEDHVSSDALGKQIVEL